MDDIVERLRAEAKELDHVRGDLLNEAAAEIRRLRSAAPSDRDVVMREAIGGLLGAMEVQEGREREEIHLSAHAFRSMWDAAKSAAKAALKTASSTGGDQP